MGDNTLNLNNTIAFEEISIYTKQRIKALLQLCKARVLDLGDDMDKRLARTFLSSLSSSPIENKNQKIVFLIRTKATARDYRLGNNNKRSVHR